MDFVAAGGSRAWFSEEQAIDLEEEDKQSPLSSSAPSHHHNPVLPYPYSSSSSTHFNNSSGQHLIHQISPSNTGPWISHSDRGDDTNSSPKCGENEGVIEREHMFDKVVTPSDVGKLNRLVIPKQHAEKYFPLDSSTNEKGLLLNFEDRGGKPWRFRYSYWNSSQSYVMTKGWSRFVKEKKLDAGDIVSFQRGLGELGKDRLYIDWRRRPDAPDPALHHFSFGRSTIPWTPFFMRPPIPPTVSFATQSQRERAHLPRLPNRNFYSGGSYGYNVVNPVYYMGSTAPQQLQASDEAVVFESVPVVQGKAAAKRLRLFGVNMECPISEEPDECDILSSSTTTNTSTTHAIVPHHHHHSQYSSSSSSSSFHPLQLRLYNGNPHPTTETDFLSKGKTSTSFDLDI